MNEKIRYCGLGICILLIISAFSSVVYSGEHEGFSEEVKSSTQPYNPYIEGDTLGQPNEKLYYVVRGTISGSHLLCYCIDWGEGTNPECGDYYPSGTPEIREHCWRSPGIYYVKAFINGGGNPSNTLRVTISNPPTKPSKPSGPTFGVPGTYYEYSTCAYDIDGDRVQYGWDWDFDGEVDEETRLYDSGEMCTISHKWNVAKNYIVQVKARDQHGLVSEWSLSLTVIISDNTAPGKPEKPTGQTLGKAGKSYSYSTVAIDPEGDKLYYLWDWGDETGSEWDGPYNSGETYEVSHIWEKSGGFDIKVKAKDEHGAESEWSDSLSIAMPKNMASLDQLDQSQTEHDGAEFLSNGGERAQGFIPTLSKLTRVQLYLNKYGSGPTYYNTYLLMIREDEPDGPTVMTSSLDASQIQSGSHWVEFNFSNCPGMLTPGRQYYVVITGETEISGSSLLYWMYQTYNPYPYGDAWRHNATWYNWHKLWRMNYSCDFCFQTYGETGGGEINNPPNTPTKPMGPTTGETGVAYSYSTYTIDPDGDPVQYGWDWNGDGIIDTWSGLYNSGEVVTESHTWTAEGEFIVKVKARDSKGAESGWSNSLKVVMPKNKVLDSYPLIQWFLEFIKDRFPQLMP